MLMNLVLCGLTLGAGASASPAPSPTPTPVVTEPQELTHPLPPPDLLWRGCKTAGIPIISFTVTRDGTTTAHRVLRTCGCASADRVYVHYIKKWRYKPATVNGRPVSTEVTTTFSVNWR